MVSRAAGCRLPIDVLIHLARSHLDIPTLASLSQASRSLADLIQPMLYRAAAREDDIQVQYETALCPSISPPLSPPNPNPSPSPFFTAAVPVVLWAASHGRLDVLDKYSRLSRHPAHLTATFRQAFRTCYHTQLWSESHVTSRLQSLAANNLWGATEEDMMALLAGTTTALHVASQNGHTRIVGWLLEAGASIDAIARYPCLCLSQHMVVLSDEHNVVEPDDGPVATPLHLAIAHGHEATTQLLLQRSPTTLSWAEAPVDAYVSSALCIMAANGMVQPMAWLASHFPHAFREAACQPDAMGLAPLYYALYATNHKTREQTFDLLLEAGADPRVRGHWAHGPEDDGMCRELKYCGLSAMQMAEYMGMSSALQKFRDAISRRCMHYGKDRNLGLRC